MVPIPWSTPWYTLWYALFSSPTVSLNTVFLDIPNILLRLKNNGVLKFKVYQRQIYVMMVFIDVVTGKFKMLKILQKYLHEFYNLKMLKESQ